MEMEEQIIEWRFNNETYHTLVTIGKFEENLGIIFDCEWFIEAKLFEETRFYLRVRGDVDRVEVGVMIKYAERVLNSVKSQCNSRTKFLKIGEFRCEKAISLSLTFSLRFIRWNKKQTSIIPEAPSLNTQIASEEYDISYTKELSEDFEAMTLQEKSSDVTVKCNSTSFNVHKLILCARSPVFKAMFESDMREKTTDTVTLDDMDPEAVRSMIQFIYSGRMHINSITEATCLLDLSEQYQIQSLKAGLVEYLKSILSLQNAIKILELADLYDKNLKEHAIKFIGNHFKTLKEEKSWKDLKSSKSSLALEVYDTLL